MSASSETGPQTTQPTQTTADAASPPRQQAAAGEKGEWEGHVLKANTNQFIGTTAIRVKKEEEEWSNFGFWFRWVLATSFGIGLNGAIVGAIAGIMGDVEHPVVEVIGYTSVLVVLLLQWLVLRPRLPRAFMWVVVGLAGTLVGAALFQGLDVSIESGLGGWTPSVEGAVQLVLEGLVLAVAQWLWLRRYAQHASRWILANLLWIALFLPILLFLGGGEEAEVPDPITGAIVNGIVLSIVGFVASAITGAEMVWLLRHRKTQDTTVEA